MTEDKVLPAVMTFGGSDASGGAGLAADVESLVSMGCHACPVVTAVTVQDTADIKGYQPLDAALVVEQARAILEDMPVAAFKIGMLGSIENAGAVHSLLSDYPGLPVVLDPVLRAGGGGNLADDAMVDAILTLLAPRATVLTPNSIEARMLSPEADTLDACGQQLLARGAQYVLITGTHELTSEVINTLYGNRRVMETFTWERLPGSYHGSGCTLAAAIAGLLAHGLEPFTAVNEAQEFTWEALKHGYRLGMGQLLPNRLFWARGAHDDSEESDQ